MVVLIEMKKTKNLPNGRKNSPRDNTKLKIVKYLYSKEVDTIATVYELLHHAEICMHDYPYLKKMLKEMTDSKWIKIVSSGPKGNEKTNYLLQERGREAVETVKKFSDRHPLKDLDTFYDI